MRQIQVTLPAGEGSDILKRLVDVVSPAQLSLVKSSDSDLILVVINPDRTGLVLELLNELGIGRVKGRITISEILTTIPPMRPRKKDKFLKRISIEELQQNVSPLVKLRFNFIALTILSSILAAMGLINDDNITIIASMIVAPDLGPIVGAAVGAMTSNRKILKEGIIAEGVGILISVAIGVIIGLIYPEPTAFILARGEPNVIDLVIAIASGLTAGVCFASGISITLIGVAAAAALLPVSVNIGLAFGMFQWNIVLGSLVLFVTNVVCVHLGCMVVFWFRKVEPPQVVKKVKAKRSLRAQIIAVVLVLLVVALPITQTTTQIIRKWRFQNITNQVAEEMLEPLPGVIYPPERLEVTIRGGVFSFQVNISIRILSTKLLPNSTQTELEEAIEERAGRNVSLTLEVILSQTFDKNNSPHYGLIETTTNEPFATRRRIGSCSEEPSLITNRRAIQCFLQRLGGISFHSTRINPFY